MKIYEKSVRVFGFLKKELEDHPILFFAGLSIFENLLIESLSRHSLFKGLQHMATSPLVFFYNALIIMMTLSFALLFRRRVFGVAVLSLPWVVCGIVNCAVLSFRVTPLGAIDFQIMKLSLLLVYLSRWQRVMIYVCVALFLLAMVLLWIVGPKISGKINYGRNVASIAGLCVAVALMTFVSQSMFAVGSNFGNIVGAYKNYGFVYCFSSSVLDTGIDQPDDYNKEKIDSITSMLPKTKNTAKMKKPDVILIQLESFFDAKTIKDVSFSSDPAPVHSYLGKKFSTGKLEVPSFGGGTANTEFEILTGINIDNFGPGEYPYKTVMTEETCETLAYNLKENGYNTSAIHNHTGNFYQRDKVYPNMGFDSFQSIEYMNNYETTPYGWCKDNILTSEIMTALTYTDKEKGVREETPRFVWTVSVQGHGAFPSEPIEGVANAIKIESDKFTQKELCALEYYVNQTWEMDMFLGNLITALEKRDRPTLLIAYGDHLPAIGLDDEDITTGNTYITEYVTWNNFGLEKEDEDIRTYELSAKIMGWLGFNNGNMTKLHHLQAKENAPFAEEEYQNLISLLSYDMLYGENFQFSGEKPYITQNMQMGTLPIVIDSVRYMDGTLYLQGERFTAKSNILVNGNKVETSVFNEGSISANDITLSEGDEITVGQIDSRRNILSYSNTVIYSEKDHLVTD